MRVTHVITALHAGGAEAMLVKLIGASRPDGVSHAVVSLMDEGALGKRLAEDGVPVACLRMRRGIPDPSALVRLATLLRRERPDVVQGWMYHANLLAGLAGAVARVPVVWGIHHADVDPRNAKRLSHWTNSLCARLSGILPARVVCCASSALESHAGLGYRKDRMVVIPNGFQVHRFGANPAARARLRAELAISPEALVVGVVARFHPDKDHRNFIAAARRVAAANASAIFVLAGEGVDGSNPQLRLWIEEAGIGDRVHLLGPRSDVPDLLAALDVLASPSRAEGFPQVLGEAMLCGVPCAVTDCGDSRVIVGPHGRAVRPRDPEALAGAILELLAMPAAARASMGQAARESVRARYDIREVARRYTALYGEVIAEARRG
jgi:glycosyltransferase involved in cell wall biosynthesis